MYSSFIWGAQAVLLFLSSAPSVLAAPRPQSAPMIDVCGIDWTIDPKKYHTSVKNGDPYPFSQRCNSTASTGCFFTFGLTYSRSTSFSVGLFENPAGNLAKSIASIAPIFSFGYSWTESYGTSESTTVNCPVGGMTCSLVALPSLCTITGPYNPKYHFPDSDGCGTLPKPKTYSSTSVCMEGNNKDKDMNAVVTYAPCLFECGKGCNVTMADTLQVCPNSPAEEAAKRKKVVKMLKSNEKKEGISL